jgi:SAM-dependent methyltransferase
VLRLISIPRSIQIDTEPTLYRQVRSKIALAHFERQLGIIKRYSKNPSRILDLGCGPGLPTIFLKQTFKKSEVHGIDVQNWKLWKRIEKLGAKFESYNGKRIPFKNRYFDFITTFGVLEHVTEFGGIEERFLKEARSKLVNGGFLFVFNLPNISSYKEVLAEKLGFNYHSRRFTKDEVLRLLEKNGFEVLYLRGFGILPAGCGPMIKLSPLLNLFAFVDKIDVDLPVCEFFDIVARKV